MLVVGLNLQKLIEQQGLVDDALSFDEQSITLNLCKDIITILGDATSEPIVYGQDVPADRVLETELDARGLVLQSGDCVLACSRQKVRVPLGYLGLIQTKGSLARLFVSVQAADGQVEGGFKGQITFELTNLSRCPVLIPIDAPVAQMFLFKATTKAYVGYKGRYADAIKPTVSRAKY